MGHFERSFSIIVDRIPDTRLSEFFTGHIGLPLRVSKINLFYAPKEFATALFYEMEDLKVYRES